jgi:diguanylate cyclase (GGDEF)-like protein/PAS domain S-box-containing protein
LDKGGETLERIISFQESLLAAQSEASIEGILVVSADGTILSYNRRFVEIWKIPQPVMEARSNNSVLQFVLPLLASPIEFMARIGYLYEHHEEKSRDEILLNDGTVLDRYSAPVGNASGEFYGRVWFFRDTTEQKRIESELQKREAELIEAQHIALLGNWDWDVATGKTNWSEALYSIYGIHPEEMVPSYEGYLSIVHPDEREYVSLQIENVLQSGHGCSHEHRIIRPDKTIRHHHVTLRTETDDDGRPIRLFGIAQDITERVKLETSLAQRVRELEAAILEREKAEKVLRTLALTDELTGLFNSRGLFALAEQQLRSDRRLGQSSLLIYADIDGLKDINDTLGHSEGSLAIAKTADILRQTFRNSDIIARLGGDEFAILAQNVSPSEIDIITAHLEENLRIHNEQGNREYQLALSVGAIVIDSSTDLNLEQLIARADQIMYDQKRSKVKPSMAMEAHAPIERQQSFSLSQ